MASQYLENYLYWFTLDRKRLNVAYDKQAEQMLIAACQNELFRTVQMFKSA